jgi:HEPN domain-containing protein
MQEYATLQISQELRLQIRNLKNEILQSRYADGVFTTQEHEEALVEACATFGIIL